MEPETEEARTPGSDLLNETETYYIAVTELLEVNYDEIAHSTYKSRETQNVEESVENIWTME